MRNRLHRQQKKNYIKFLEEDVIRLRDMISVVESETVIYQQDNAAMRSTLTMNGVQTVPVQLPVLDLQPLSSAAVSGDHLSLQGGSPNQIGASQPLQQSPQWTTHSDYSPSTTSISVGFDEQINANRLRVSPVSDSGSQRLRNTVPTTYTSNVEYVPEFPDPSALFADPPPQFANLDIGALETMPSQPETSFVGINFILA